MTIRIKHIIIALAAVVICALALAVIFRKTFRPIVSIPPALKTKKTVAERVEEFGAAVQERLAPPFARIGVVYPPQKIILVGLKQEKTLEVWVSQGDGPPKFLKSYPILAASGTLGPKLKEGDLQVPEGLYKIDALNPNSRFHLSLRVNYPNPFDKIKGKLDGRENLGCDIMIHGQSSSIGCLAIGDEAAEELFILAAETGIQNISVILSPVDFRVRSLPAGAIPGPDWISELYQSIQKELLTLKKTSFDLSERTWRRQPTVIAQST